MTENSAIEWTDHTFNPWWGCVRISPGCRFCYADKQAKRYGHEVWRKHGPRRMLSEGNWQKPLRWNRDAERLGQPAKVFCASMADVFEDHPDVGEARERLWGLIGATPWLQWQLLTKRPENVTRFAPWGLDWPENVWLGTSAESQRWANERIPALLRIPARVRFISAEPLVGPVDLRGWLGEMWKCRQCGMEQGQHTGSAYCFGCGARNWPLPVVSLDWVIAGGESGPKARECHAGWLAGLAFQCENAGIPVFMKQAGAVLGREWGCKDRKGGDWAAWPEDLRIRQFPASPVAVSS